MAQLADPAPSPWPRSPRQVTIMGVRMDLLDENELVEQVFSALDRGEGGWIVTPNVDIVRQCSADAELAALVDSATLRVVDGAPLEWASRMSGQWHGERIPGSAMPTILGCAARERGRALLMVGGRQGAAEAAATRVRESFPGLATSSYFPPFGFESSELEWTALQRAVGESEADVVFVGLGFPKQERVIAALHEQFPGIWFVGCGAAIDFAAGVVPRAPRWVQRAGIEWGYRVLKEPRRLARRYFVHDLPFAARMLGSAAAQPLRSLAT